MISKVYLFLVSLFSVGFVLLMLGVYQSSQEASGVLGQSASPDFFPVKRVIDGDTIEVDTGQSQTVRLIGINTPETVDPRKGVECFGKEASQEVRQLLKGRRVKLVKDVSETDSFKRLLRLVYVELDDGAILFLNDYLVRMGFATVATYPPDINFIPRFLEAQKQAIDQNLGLWAKCPGLKKSATSSATIILQ